jgi:hypothetical protein
MDGDGDGTSRGVADRREDWEKIVVLTVALGPFYELCRLYEAFDRSGCIDLRKRNEACRRSARNSYPDHHHSSLGILRPRPSALLLSPYILIHACFYYIFLRCMQPPIPWIWTRPIRRTTQRHVYH